MLCCFLLFTEQRADLIAENILKNFQASRLVNAWHFLAPEGDFPSYFFEIPCEVKMKPSLSAMP